MNLVLQFLTIVLPQFPQLAEQFRAAFREVGGTDEEFDKILSENKILIDKLANPDVYFDKQGGPTPFPPPPEPAVFPYDKILDEAPDESRLKSGDGIYGNDPTLPTQWIVNGGVGRTPKPPNWHLLKTMP